MSRVIKFRAWIMLENGEAFMVEPDEISFNAGFVRLYDENANEFEYDLDRVALMQFSGLLDKNEKEIFEGDVVNCICHVIGNGDKDYGKRVVIWWEDEIRFALSEPWKEECFSSKFIMSKDAYELEILGNIHENPELLSHQPVKQGEGR